MLLYANNAVSTLRTALTQAVTLLMVDSADAEKFPHPAQIDDAFLVTLEDRTQTPVVREIVRCTARVGSLLTVLRAQEGTTARAFPIGTLVSHRLTAGSLTDFQQTVSDAAAQAATTAAVAATAQLTAGLASLLASKQGVTRPQMNGILLPFYVYPAFGFNPYTDTTYQRLLGLMRQYRNVPIVLVFNTPSNGPGTVADGNISAAIRVFRASGASVLGYVDTSFGARSDDAVKADIAKWQSLYPDTPPDGIFLDQMMYDPGLANANVNRYAGYTDYCHGRGLSFVVGNPGSDVPQAWFDARAVDVICAWEGAAWPTESQIATNFVGGHVDYANPQIAAIVYNQATLDVAKLAMVRKYAPWVYITDDNTPNPYDTLPAYLEQLFAALAAPNSEVTVALGQFGGSPSATALQNRQAAQKATKYLKAVGGGTLHIPGGTYNWDVARPVVVPSNTRIQGDRGATLIVPDITTIVDSTTLTFPTANIGVFVTGDPVAGTRAGVTHSGTFNGHAGTYVDPATVVSNVHFDGLRIESAYAGPQLTSSKYLQGIMLIFCHGGSVTNCVVKGMISNGINVQYSRDIIVRGNVCELNGFYAPYPSACNGIHASGWYDPSDIAQTSYGLIIEGNHASYNRDEGIQHGLWSGTVIRGNVLIGNGDKGIEGDSGLVFANTSTYYNQVVPGDCIITDNYIDGAIPAWVPTNPWGVSYTGVGIGVADANQSKLIINNNLIKNLAINSQGSGASGIGISATQANNMEMIVANNLIDNVQSNSGTAVGSGIILSSVEKCLVSGNMVTGCGLYVTAINVGGWQSNFEVTIADNVVDNCEHVFYVGVGQGPANAGASLPFVVIEGNRAHAIRRDFGQVVFSQNQTLRALRIANNTFLRGNLGSGAEGGGNVAFGLGLGSGGLTPTLQELWISGNELSTGANYNYLLGAPFGGWINLASGAITKAAIRNNSFSPFNNTPSYIDTPAIITKLDEGSNGLPGQYRGAASAAPTTGTWAVGDLVWNTVPATGQPLGWVCTVAGTPGTWVSFATL